MFESFPNSDSDIVFVGDSITDRVEFAELFQDYKCKNRGIESDTSIGMLNRIDEISEGNPAICFMLIGINDVGDGVPREEYCENMKHIIQNLKNHSPHTTIYIQSIMPCNDMMMEKNERNSRRTEENIADYNMLLQDLCKQEFVNYLNLWDIMADNNGQLIEMYTYDGVHLNMLGIEAWRDYLLRYIEG